MLSRMCLETSEMEKDIREVRDNGRTAAETKRGSVTAKGCFIRMRGSIVHLHKGSSFSLTRSH